VSGPETWVTDYAEEMGNTFDPKGFARGSSLQIVRPVTGTPERAVDYVFKTIPRGRVSYEDGILGEEEGSRPLRPPCLCSVKWIDSPRGH
jgi:hypothetical protein